MKRAALFAVAALCAAPSSARTIRVAKDGSGDVKTLGAALSKADSGDVLAMVGQGLLGITVQKAGSAFDIVFVAAGSPAEKAGIKAHDRMVLVDDRDVSGLSGPDLVALLRGAEGSQVKLHVQAAGSDEAKAYTLTRGPRQYTVTDDNSRMNVASSEGDGDSAVKYAEKAAKAGDLRGMEALMFWFYNGYEPLGIKRDDARSWKWARKAAEAGSHNAEQTLGAMYLEGRGVAKDLGKFYEYSRKAALAGVPWGERNLGIAYAYGYGVQADDAGAETWLKRAAGHGIEQAQKDYDAWRKYKDALAAQAQGARPAPQAAAPALTRADIQEMMRAALKEERPAEKPAPAAKVSDVDSPTYAKKERPDDLAVVIGIEKYESLPDASYAERDADAVRAHLVALGFPERNVFMLSGQKATKSAFIKELEARLKRLAKPDSTVFVYYSGHGAPDPKSGAAYLVPFDGDPEFLDETAYPVKRLYQKLGALPAKRVIVALDSCFSGAGGRSVLAKGARPLVTMREESAPAGKIVALTASSGAEISGALDEQGHGLFTYYLLDGLNKGKTNLDELAKYVRPKVEDEARRHNRDQTPRLIGAGDTELGQ